MERALARAIERDELVLHFQPIVSVVSAEVRGYEALVRWPQPDGTLVPPLDFVPVAEYSDLICDLDAWVMAAGGRAAGSVEHRTRLGRI